MLRVVSFRRAVTAGAAGAAAWDVAVRGLGRMGMPTFDLVRSLGTLVLATGNAMLWWPPGMMLHVFAGALWAVFYAYFFWGRLPMPGWLQGIVFASLPAALATLIVVPQLRLMHVADTYVSLDWNWYLKAWSPATLGSLAIGHLVFGVTMGSVYKRPVGYRDCEAPDLACRPGPLRRKASRGRSTGDAFIFATGIECSYPTIEHGQWRRDEMLSMRHYEFWQRDFELARQVGVSHLRYGPPLHLIFEAPGVYRWERIDEAMADLELLGPDPIVDLCHFGLPGWLGNFQNDEIGSALAEYASAFARRYPWVRFYTPVNEMYVCARLSALDGLWNEQLRDEAAFMSAAFNLADASMKMSQAIVGERADAVFINSESGEFYQPCCPDPEVQARAELENERRFLPLDLLYGHPVSDDMRGRIAECGRSKQHEQLIARSAPRRTILGVDYYEWNEKLIDTGGQVRSLGELFGWHVIASQYWDRYRRPMMHTETNRIDASDAPRWLWRQWHNVQLLRRSGVPLVGFTWYSLTDQVDWGTALAETKGVVDPVGLFDLNRDPRLVGLAYRHLIDLHRNAPGYRKCEALREVLC